MTTQQATGSFAPVNGTTLYYETRGTGSAILLIPGIPGDAGQFTVVADELARDHLVVTYDRRGNSRSSVSVGPQATSVAEQAADAAALLESLEIPQAVVYGSSNGAIIGLELARARPDLVAGLMAHEAPLISVVKDPGPIAAAIADIIEPAFASGGPDAALEAFLRFAFGDATFDAIDDSERARYVANGELAMAVEMPAFQAYVPAREELSALQFPIAVLVGEDQQVPLFKEAAEWIAAAVGSDVLRASGAHGPQFDQPRELARLIARFARDTA